MPKSLPCLLLWAALCLPSKSASQTIKSPIPRDTSVCIPATAARRIDATLAKFPKLLTENKRLRENVDRYEGIVQQDAVALTAKDTVIAATSRRVVVAQALGRDAENRASFWKGKARSRFWLLVGETALLLGGVVLAAGR